jgi:hypothetical protein
MAQHGALSTTLLLGNSAIPDLNLEGKFLFSTRDTRHAQGLKTRYMPPINCGTIPVYTFL